MGHVSYFPLRTILRTAITLAFVGCTAQGSTPMSVVPAPGASTLVQRGARAAQDLYIGNILGGVLLYSTGKNPAEVGDITDQVPRVTSVWVDQKGVLYAYSDNRSEPYETIEEFEPGASSPFFSLAVKRYGAFAVADAQQNVYAQAENSQAQQVIDVYPPGSQSYTNEYVVPSLGQISGPESMAFDSNGALLVGVVSLAQNRQGQISAVFRLDQSSGMFENLNLQKTRGGLIATDAAGHLFVGGNKTISVYGAGATKASRVIHTQNGIVALTAASDGTLYVAQEGSSGIVIYPPGKDHAKSGFDPEAQVSGLALGPG